MSQLVGHTLPDPTSFTTTNVLDHTLGISAHVTACTFGHDSSLPQLEKAVSLFVETASKPITLAILKDGFAETAAASAGRETIKSQTYNGLGTPALYVTTTVAGYTFQSLIAARGTTLFSVETAKSVSRSTLVALVRLALAKL